MRGMAPYDLHTCSDTSAIETLVTMTAGIPVPGQQRSYWLREAMADEPESAPSPPLEDGAHHDVVIVGGGYTGLWTAYFLGEIDSSIRIAIVEQDVCGGGPSGRNGGFLHGWWDQLPLLERLYGPDAALAVAREADETVDGVRAFLARHAIDAWYRRAGYLRVSASRSQDAVGRDGVDACRRLGVADQLFELGEADVQARCASPVFRRGTFMPNAATVQPARLARGLRRVLLERGVFIHEGVAATRIVLDRDGGVTVRTPVGRLRARQAVLAVNAWAAGWAGHRRSIVSWGSYMALTEPCAAVLDRIGWTGGEAIADARFTVHYFRTTPDGRVAFGAGVGPAGYGGRIGPSFDRDVRSAQRAVRGLRRLLPALADVGITETWGGPIDVSADRLPEFGTSHRGRVHHAHGYSGNGVGPTRLAGRILAARIARPGDPVARLPIANHRSRRFPPEPARSLGVRLVREALIRRDEAEDDGRRPGPLTRGLVRLPGLLGYRLGTGG
jgi:glycine/D-amino acid oxidase-like deaminating enzyme